MIIFTLSGASRAFGTVSTIQFQLKQCSENLQGAHEDEQYFEGRAGDDVAAGDGGHASRDTGMAIGGSPGGAVSLRA